jgi:dihydropteroate synthase
MDLTRPVVMGIVNVTPDSFSDGGDCYDPAMAIQQARAMIVSGAGILDIGGESTRPGSDPVDATEEQRRILPVIEGLSGAGCPVSVDTRRADTMAAALSAGAGIINDVSALTFDEGSLSVAARSDAPVVLMHAQGDPRTMQQSPVYENVLLDVFDYLEERVKATEAAGVPRHQIIVDPGIGFGKNLSHNLALLDGIGLFHGLGCPVLLGVSRKSFIGRISGEENARARVPGSLAVASLARTQGVQIFRVHDVAETVQALSLTEAVINGAGQEGPWAHS